MLRQRTKLGGFAGSRAGWRLGLTLVCAAGVSLPGLALARAAGAGYAAEYQPSHGATAGQGYLGIIFSDVADDQISALRLKDAHGAVIVHVDHDGPAGKMGLRERDVVLQINGMLIDGAEQMRRMLREMAPGHVVAMIVNRDGQQMLMTAQMADRGQVERQAWKDHLGGDAQAPATGLPTGDVASTDAAPAGPAVSGGRYSRGFLGTLLSSPSYTGVILEKMGPQLAGFFGVQSGPGMLVRSVEPNSPAAMAGVKAGDVIVRANAHAVGSTNEWMKLIKEAKGSPVTVVVVRDRAEKTLTLTPDGGKRRSSVEGIRTGPDEVILQDQQMEL